MAANIIGNIIFSSIGFIAFVYGKKMAEYRILGFGLALMVFPYFIPDTLWLYIVGCALTIAMFVFKE